MDMYILSSGVMYVDPGGCISTMEAVEVVEVVEATLDRWPSRKRCDGGNLTSRDEECAAGGARGD
jgi:hypothetical protein